MNKLISFVKEFTKDNIPEVSKLRKIGRSYFLTGNELEEASRQIVMEPFSAGLFFGEVKDGRFKPGFPLLDLLSKYTRRKAVLGDKGQVLFLYRNNIFEESIKKLDEKSGFVLVMNEQDEVLGYGEVNSKGRQVIIKHILDRSDFLKREGKK